MGKVTVKVILKEKVCSIMKIKMKMILDTNLKLIKDGNISALYMQKMKDETMWGAGTISICAIEY